MKIKIVRIIGFLCIILGIGLITMSMILKSTLILFIGVIILVVSTLITILIPALQIFSKDYALDKKALIQQGLHIVSCNECGKENVLEDIYCIHCGADLVIKDE
jgi:hypothetical protein